MNRILLSLTLLASIASVTSINAQWRQAGRLAAKALNIAERRTMSVAASRHIPSNNTCHLASAEKTIWQAPAASFSAWPDATSATIAYDLGASAIDDVICSKYCRKLAKAYHQVLSEITDARESTAEHLAVTLEKIPEKYCPTVLNNTLINGRPILFASFAAFFDKDAVQLLLKNGANPNVIEADVHGAVQSTALHYALFCYQARRSFLGHITNHPILENGKAVIRLLLAKGADVNAQDMYGNTPLYRAVRMGLSIGEIEVVELLAAVHNANPTIPNNMGESAISKAENAVREIPGNTTAQEILAILKGIEDSQILA